MKKDPWKPSSALPLGKWWVGLTVAEVINEPDARGYLLRLLYILQTAKDVTLPDDVRARLKAKESYIPREQSDGGHLEVNEVVGAIVGKTWLGKFKRDYRVWPADVQ